MLKLRCTTKLIARLNVKVDPTPPSSTATLGDRFGNLLNVGRNSSCSSSASVAAARGRACRSKQHAPRPVQAGFRRGHAGRGHAGGGVEGLANVNHNRMP